LLPHANIVSHSWLMQDRFITLGSPGMMLAAALVIEELARRSIADVNVRRKAMLACGGAWIVMLMAISFFRSNVFADSESVELHAANAQPDSSFAQLAAARIFRTRVDIPESGTITPQSKAYAASAIAMYARALAAADFDLFGNPFIVRVRKAEMVLLLEDYEGVRKTLENWLPPKDMAVLPSGSENEFVPRHQMNKGYRPEALAHAWAVVAESYLRQSAIPGMVYSQRMPLIEMGMEAAKQSMLAHSHDFEGAMVLARLLLQASELLKGKDLDSARGAWDEAAALLVAIPESSTRAPLAAELMRRVKRP
jgi:hypothetical protein